MQMNSRVIAVAALLSLGLPGCTDLIEPPTPRATTMEAMTSTIATGFVATEVFPAPQVRVTDQEGRPMKGIEVLFRFAGIAPTPTDNRTVSVLTDINGFARVSWSLGTVVGEYRATATSPDLPAVVTFTATARPGPGTTMTLMNGVQRAPAGTPLSLPLSIVLRDAFSNAVPGAPVTFSVISGGGSIAGDTVRTDASGVATSGVWTLGATVGSQHVIARAAGVTLDISADAHTGAVATIVRVSGHGQGGAVGVMLRDPLSVRITDSFNNPVAGVAVAFSVLTGGGRVAESATTDDDGVASAGYWTLGPTVGEQRIEAVVGTLRVEFTAVAYADWALVFLVQPKIMSVSSPSQQRIEVGVVDSDGRVVDTFADISMAVSGTEGPVRGLGGTSAVEGTAVFWIHLTTPGTYVLEATSPGITSAKSRPFTVTALPPLGSIEIITTSTGSPMPAALTVSLDGAAPVAIGANALRLFEGLVPGNHTIQLSGIGDACMVAGSNPRSLNLIEFDTVRVSFALSCAQVGSMRVTTTTTGTDPDPNGYTLEIKRDGFITAVDVPTSGTVDKATTAFGTHAVTLKGIAENCRVSGGRTRQVDVSSGTTPAVNFEISCVPVTQLAFVREGQIYLINSNGTGLVQLTSAASGSGNGDPAWSPDGTRLAFSRADSVYVMNADGSNVVLRATGSASPSWSPDGRRLAVAYIGISTIAADDGGTGPVVVIDPAGSEYQPAWSPDGGTILFVSDWNYYDVASDVFAVNLDGSNPRVLLHGTHYNPAWSPDGRRIAVGTCPYAYGYTTCYPSAVVVANADGSGATVLAHTSGDVKPTWSPDGSTLAYFATDCPGCPTSIRYVRADGSYEDGIVTNGHSPAWRPR